MTLIFLFIIAFAIFAIGAMMGIYVGVRMKQNVYHGAIVCAESENGMVYQLQIAGDPELIVFEDSIVLKVVAPDYEELLAK